MRPVAGWSVLVSTCAVLAMSPKAEALLPGSPSNPAMINCSGSQQMTIRAAWQIVQRQILGDQASQMKECLVESFRQGEANGDQAQPGFPDYATDISHVGNAYPEWIMHRLSDTEPTTITCTAQSQARFGPERIEISGSVISGGPAMTAQFILHELTHTKGLSHFDGFSDVGWAPPQMLQSYSGELSAGRACVNWRSEVPQETTLAPVGVGMGARVGWSSSGQTCAGASIGMGVFGTVSSSRIFTLGLVCKTPGQTTVGSRTWPAQFLGSSQPAFELSCSQANGPAVMVGASGAADVLLKGMRAICAPESDVRNEVIGPRTTTAFAGDPWGIDWVRQCPAGMAVKALRVRGFDHVSRFEMTCQKLTNAETITTSSAPWVGGNWGPGWFIEEKAFGRDALNGLEVQHDGTAITRFSARSRRVIGSGASATLGGGDIEVPGYGRNTSETAIAPVRRDCGGLSTNRVMVGLWVNWNAGAIRGLQGICAPITGWTSESQFSYMPMQGNAPGQWTRTLCSPNQYMIGYSANASDYLHIIQPTCRQF